MEQTYTKSQELLTTLQKAADPLLDASVSKRHGCDASCSFVMRNALCSQMKKYKFDLQKAVNTPINSISRVSGSHLREKLQRLAALLSRKQVDVGNARVSVATHPSGYDFCKDLIAKKIVVSVTLAALF